ncbi:MAG TPA: peptide chain release factor N(5)-glutamine methyltransferase [Firmicutes bacterium]|nr:peptide chain release factor N(5)-glutamine methyltransferase [Bacillota bacterium]
MAATYNNLYLDARRALRQAGIEAAQMEARELLGHAAGKSRQELFRDLALYAPEGVEERFQQLLERRLAGEPVAYIIGEWEFYGLTLSLCRDVLIPRVDTETLAERGILAVRALGRPARVLDLCAGSGCVGLAVADNCPQCHVVLADWSEQALRVCRKNIQRCGLSGRVSAARADALALPPALLRDFDLILCNPPYIPTGELAGLEPSVRDYEPRQALDGGEDGLSFYRAVSDRWKTALCPGGRMAFEVGWNQAPDVEYLLGRQGFQDIQTHQDAGGNWRVVEGVLAP